MLRFFQIATLVAWPAVALVADQPLRLLVAILLGIAGWFAATMLYQNACQSAQQTKNSLEHLRAIESYLVQLEQAEEANGAPRR